MRLLLFSLFSVLLAYTSYAQVCNTLSLPDTLHACAGSLETLPASLAGTDSVLSIHWSPVTGLSDTGVLDPVLTVSTSGWYTLTVESLIPDNLIVNSNFSAGNTGFTSPDYTYSVAVPYSNLYTLSTDIFLADPGFPNHFYDHTNPPTGLMMVTNGGSPASNTRAWQETVPVTAGDKYEFTAWYAYWTYDPSGVSNPNLYVTITPVGGSGAAATNVFAMLTNQNYWSKELYTWTAPPGATGAIIQILDGNSGYYYNDFCLDDISFQPICTTMDSIYVQTCTSCNTLTLPDSLVACTGSTTTLNAVLAGPDSVLNIHWSPATGLSDTGILNPVLTVSNPGWYSINVESIIPGNLVVNGDFSTGNTGFSSGYSYVSGPGSLLPANVYAITTDPHLDHPTAASFGDHTSGTGNMMAVNGASTPIDIWCETITVAPNTNYVFSAWFANWSSDTSNNFPILQFQVNGTLIGAPFNFPHADGQWTQFYTTWNSGTNTSINICIYDQQTAATGNDFAIDDISFQQLCNATDSIYVSVSTAGSATQNTDTVVCSSASGITLVAPPVYSNFHWNNGNTAAAANINTSGIYWVAETGSCGTFTDTFHVTCNAQPVVELGNDTEFCQGGSLMLSSLQPSGTTYLWNTGSTNDSVLVTKAGTYWLTVTNNGCNTTDSVNIAIVSVPTVNLGPDTTLCSGQQLNLLTDTYATTYLWSDGSDGENLVVSQAGTYWATVSNQCGTVSDTMNVAFDFCDIWFPSAFTPNNDGLNDIARVRGSLGDFTDFSLSIVNRFGQVVFFTQDIYAGWDGNFNNTKQDVGTYFYMVNYSLNGKKNIMKGDLQLIR